MLASRVRPSEQAAFRELAGDEGAVLLQLGSGGYHGLNRMGCLIWGLIEDEPTLGELIAALRARVTDPPETLDAEVAAFVTDLRERDLVTVAPPDP
jgi:Coenzyme PQQ synthesis protein D (PqqD)